MAELEIKTRLKEKISILLFQKYSLKGGEMSRFCQDLLRFVREGDSGDSGDFVALALCLGFVIHPEPEL